MLGLRGRERRFAIVISVAHATQHFLMRLIPPLIPVLAVALEYPLWQLGLLVSVYSFGGGLVQAPLGVLADRYDRLFILPTGIAVAGSAYVLFASAPLVGPLVPDLTIGGYTFEGPFAVMFAAMLGVGLGAAVVHPTAYPLMSANVSDARKGTVLGLFGSSSKVGDAAAPAVVAVLILTLVWSEVLLVLGILCIAISGVLFFVLRLDDFDTTPSRTTPVDPVGVDGPGSSGDVGDRRTYLYPLTIIYVFFITKMFAGNGLSTFLPVFLIGIYAYTIELPGLTFSPESVANFYFSALLLAAAGSQLVMGRLTDRLDARWVILGSLGMATAGILFLSVVELSPLLLLLVMVLIGAGLWGNNPARDALISEISPADREGRTFGYLWSAVQLSRSVIPVVVGYAIEVVGMRTSILIFAGGTALAFVAISSLFSDLVYVPTADRLPPAQELDQSD